MYGFIDFDLLNLKGYKNFVPPNLELMKLAQYFSQEEKQICRIITEDFSSLGAYEKVFVRADFSSIEDIKKILPPSQNIHFGGKSFTGGKYTPLRKSIIEFSRADPRLYNPLFKSWRERGMIKDELIQIYLRHIYYRLVLGNKILPLPVVGAVPWQNLILYDDDLLSIDDWDRKLQSQIADKKISRIHSVNPIKCPNLSAFRLFKEQPKFLSGTEVILDFNVPIQDQDYFIKEYRSFLQSYIAVNTPVYFYIGKDYSPTQFYSQDFYEINLIKTIEFMKRIWKNSIPIKLKYYREPEVKNPYDAIFQRVETWSYRGLLNENITLLSGAKKEFKEQYELFRTRRPKDTNIFWLNPSTGGTIHR